MDSDSDSDTQLAIAQYEQSHSHHHSFLKSALGVAEDVGKGVLEHGAEAGIASLLF